MRRRHFIGLASSALLLGAPSLAQARARQISFQRWQADSDIVFDYRLADYAGREVRLGFRLAGRIIDESRRLVSAFAKDDLGDYVEAALHNYIDRHSPHTTVEIRRDARGLEFVVRGTSQSEVNSVTAALSREYDRVQAEYLRKGFLVVDQRKVFIDYGRVVGYYAPILRSVSHALASATNGAGANGRLGLALAFLQTIPYDTLQTRDVESGFDFVTPPTLFDINKGDCDSKAVALAAILRTLIDNAAMIMVLLPQHAVLGIDLPAKADDATLSHGGRQYLLLEAAGSAPYPPGKLFPQSAAAIKGRRIDRIAVL